MCVNYTPTRKELLEAKFDAPYTGSTTWRDEIWQDYLAPIIRHTPRGERETLVASYGMMPKSKMPAGSKRYSTMNARAETLGQLKTYAPSWRNAWRCLVPLSHFFEPNYESGKAQRWKIGLKDDSDFAVAGLYRPWDESDGTESFSFTQITINADQHPLMNRFHPAGEEKRSLVILHRDDYDDWLSCKNPELARAYLQLFPAEAMVAEPMPLASKKVEIEKAVQAPPVQPSLFD